MFGKILVATDGSIAAKEATLYAMKLASSMKAKLIVVNVIDLPHQIPGEASPEVLRPLDDYLGKTGNSLLDEIETSCRQQGINCKRSLRRGHAVTEILKEAEEEKADIIIMGPHGRIHSDLLGDITMGVSQRSRIPVLIFRA